MSVMSVVVMRVWGSAMAMCVAMGLAGCDDEEDEGGDGGTPAATPSATVTPTPSATVTPTPTATVTPSPAFAGCTGLDRPRGQADEDWEHFATGIVVALGPPGHSAQDVIAVVGRDTQIAGKFAYGFISKDLEDEWVEVYLNDCTGGWRLLADQRTDTDGRIAVPIAAGELPPIGVYDVFLRVRGDDSSARATLRVVPAGTRFVVFDIDATLTTDDMELFRDLMAELFAPIFHGDYVPEARPGAAEITRVRGVEQRYQVIYLTGRPYLLTEHSRRWLVDVGCAPGVVHVADEVSEVVPTEAAVGSYKARYLESLVALGVRLERAYGNAPTDIYAYERAGIPPEHTYVLGRHGGERGTVDLGDDYVAHLPVARAEPAAEQPFR
jgi:hypothetical protein